MMYNSSSTLHCVMDNDVFNSPLEMTDRNPMLMDAITSNVFSSSFVLPEAPDLNSQTQIMTGYPSVSTVREVINDLHISNHTGGIDSDEPVSRYSSLMRGASFPTSALLFEDNTLNSSISASVNHEYDGDMEYLEANKDGNIIDQLQSKWDPYRCIGSSDPDSWISSENSSVSLDHPYNYCMPSKDLSLSLATSQPSGVNQHSLTLGFGSHEPFHFSHIFSGTKYLHVVQKILAEIARYSLENFDQWSYSPKGIVGVEKISCSSSSSAEREVSMMNSDELPFSTGETGDEGQMKLTLQREEVEAKKAQLLALLQVVDSRYNQCLDEIHTVISAFHAVSELDPQTHTRFALQTISLLYQNLRERITNQILMIGECLNGVFLKEKDKSLESSFIQKQWDFQQPRRKDLQSWKPQRGLPERSVSVLRAWMFQNFLHPYPKDSEKHILAIRSGLTRSQVSNWFINARVRLWKPMIEEMYSEMNNRKGRRIEGTDSDHRSSLRFDNQIMRMN